MILVNAHFWYVLRKGRLCSGKVRLLSAVPRQVIGAQKPEYKAMELPGGIPFKQGTHTLSPPSEEKSKHEFDLIDI